MTEDVGPVLVRECRFGRIPHVLSTTVSLTKRVVESPWASWPGLRDDSWLRNIPRQRLDGAQGKYLSMYRVGLQEGGVCLVPETLSLGLLCCDRDKPNIYLIVRPVKSNQTQTQKLKINITGVGE